MTSFDDREKAFEKKFAMDQDLQFKTEARRNKLFGLWAAQKLGLSGAEADAYARTVVAADFEEAGDDDVLRKVRGDLATKSIKMDDKELRQQMTMLLAEAKRQLASEMK